MPQSPPGDGRDADQHRGAARSTHGPDDARARVLAELAAMFPVALVRGKAVDGLIDLVLEAPPDERVRVLTARIHAASTMTAWYSLHRNAAVQQMRDEGASYERVSAVLGVSKSRAQQLCQRLAAGAALPPADLTREVVLDELTLSLPMDEATPALVDSLVDLVLTGTPDERARAITVRAATASRIVLWYSSARDQAVADMLLGGAGPREVAAALGVSRSWAQTLLVRVRRAYGLAGPVSR